MCCLCTQTLHTTVGDGLPPESERKKERDGGGAGGGDGKRGETETERRVVFSFSDHKSVDYSDM